MATVDRDGDRAINRDVDRDPDPSSEGSLRLHHLRVGLQPGPAGWDEPAEELSLQLGELLAPFVAWLATQTLDEDHRRRYRDAAERYLRWCVEDDGPVRGRRVRYERHVQQSDPGHLSAARAGVDWWMRHRQLLAVTLPVDG